MTLVVTLVLFLTVGAGAASVLRLVVPATIPGVMSFWYLTGIAVLGTILYVLGALGVRLSAPVIAVIAIAALVCGVMNRKHLRRGSRVRHSLPASVALILPLAALLAAAWILPIRDFDGRVTWLPKALAIAHDGTLDGPFFQGEAGLNLHNEYPLLMPLDAAAVLIMTDRFESAAARWLYVLIAVAALVAARDLMAVSQPQASAWAVAIAAWVPMLVAIEGGALAAYNDVAILALTGIALVALNTPEIGDSRIRTAAVFLAALVLTKNEGSVIALAILVSVAAMRGLRRSDWITLVTPTVGAIALLIAWRGRVPAAYDEQYDVLIVTLFEVLHRLLPGATALASHGLDRVVWGWFWPLTVVAAVVSLASARRARAGAPLLLMTIMFCVYSASFAVTSWKIEELAQVAASRLLLHLVIPACFVIACAGELLWDSPTDASSP